MSWWRAQRRALIALLVCAGAVVGAYLWLDVRPWADGDDDRVVVAEDSTEISGQTVTLGPVEWDEFEAPQGSRTLSIRFRASGGAEADSCGPFSLTEERSSRVWLSSRTHLDVPYDEGESSCQAETAPYRILIVFLVPDDAVGPFRLDIAGRDDDIARFLIEP